MLLIRLISFFSVFCLSITLVGAKEWQRVPSIAFSCAACHGESNEGYGSIPNIRQKTESEFIRKMESFRNVQPTTIMGRIAQGITDDELTELAKYFSH